MSAPANDHEEVKGIGQIHFSRQGIINHSKSARTLGTYTESFHGERIWPRKTSKINVGRGHSSILVNNDCALPLLFAINPMRKEIKF